MFRKSDAGKGKDRKADAQQQLELEVAEIGEIAERLYQRIDRKMSELLIVEKRIDEKKRVLEQMIIKAEEVEQLPDRLADIRRREIGVLASRGLKIDEIAAMFGIPRGEVELIIGLSR